MIAMRRMAAVAIALLLHGCAGHPEWALAPVTAAASGDTVSLLVMTNRAATDRPGVLFGGEPSPTSKWVKMVVSVPPGTAHRVGEVQWPSHLPPDPRRDFAALSTSRLSDAGIADWLRAHNGRRVVLYVHGFNTDFAKSVFRFVQVAHDTHTDRTPVLFSWPSRGSPWGYLEDRAAAEASVGALVGLIDRLAAEPLVSDVTIVAHSMGARLAMGALATVAERDRRLPAKVGRVILAAPDLTVDEFEDDAIRFVPGPKLTLLVARDDRLLAMSRAWNGGDVRLGAIDPNSDPRSVRLASLGVEFVDFADLPSDGRFDHERFFRRPEALVLLAARLDDPGPVAAPPVTARLRSTTAKRTAVRRAELP